MACEKIYKCVDAQGYITVDQYNRIWHEEMSGHCCNPPPGTGLPVLTQDMCMQDVEVILQSLEHHDSSAENIQAYRSALSAVIRLLEALPADFDID
jgi:hypothetical protein